MPAGRPREFDEAEVLERAMDLFWRRGYQGVGLSELLAHMGIARQSLYDTFGNKRDLFIATIRHYRATRLAPALAALDREGSPLENVRSVVRYFERMAQDRDARGCLVANTLVELGPHDEEIGALLKETLGLLEKGIERALVDAQERGELAASRKPREVARALTNSLLGLAVTGKLGLGRRAIDDIYRGTLALLA